MNNKYGKPQGNELVYGTDIIRRVDTFEFILIERFQNSEAAHSAYQQWMAENNLPDTRWKHPDDYKIWTDAKENILKQKDTCPIWKYTKPIIGWDENGQLIIYDSWGEKK